MILLFMFKKEILIEGIVFKKIFFLREDDVFIILTI